LLVERNLEVPAGADLPEPGGTGAAPAGRGVSFKILESCWFSRRVGMAKELLHPSVLHSFPFPTIKEKPR